MRVCGRRVLVVPHNVIMVVKNKRQRETFVTTRVPISAFDHAQIRIRLAMICRHVPATANTL